MDKSGEDKIKKEAEKEKQKKEGKSKISSLSNVGQNLSTTGTKEPTPAQTITFKSELENLVSSLKILYTKCGIDNEITARYSIDVPDLSLIHI